MIPVRQSTAFECCVGPVLDADGVAVTGCVVADFKIKKTSGNFAALNGSATLTHVSAGFYDLVLTTSDVDTVGLSAVAIDDTTNCCPPLYLQVIEEAVYDVWFAASATGAVLLQATQTGVTIPTVTTLTNLPAITSNWITAAGITNDAFTAAKFAADVTTEFQAGLATAAALTTVDDFLDTEIAAIKTKTDFLPSATAGAAGGLFIAGSNAATTVNITGNLSGSVGSVTGAVGSVTGAVGSVTGAVGSIASGGITAASLDATVQARLGIVAYGTAQSATGTTLVLASASAFADDELIGAVLVITGGTTGVGQARVITDSVLSTDTVTVDAWTTTPTGTITYVVFAAAPASATALPAVNVTQFGGSAGTFTSGRPEVNTTHAAGTAWGSGAITAASIAADAITDAKVASDVTIASVTGSVGSIATGGITAASIATGAIDADALAADAGAELADAVLDRAITEPSGVFAWGAASLRTVIQLVGAMARNKQTQTATTYTLRNDADSGTIASATVSDDGTTTTKGELS
jgi:hypothetical protein